MLQKHDDAQPPTWRDAVDTADHGRGIIVRFFVYCSRQFFPLEHLPGDG